jgi:hypothetical protein
MGRLEGINLYGRRRKQIEFAIWEIRKRIGIHKNLKIEIAKLEDLDYNQFPFIDYTKEGVTSSFFFLLNKGSTKPTEIGTQVIFEKNVDPKITTIGESLSATNFNNNDTIIHLSFEKNRDKSWDGIIKVFTNPDTKS